MANLYYLSDYSTFDNTQELNNHVKQHTNRRYYDMNETQRQVLQVLAQYGVKHNGACHLKVDTIAQAVNKSVSTVIRAIRVLVALNIIEKQATTKPVKGGSGANIYIILPFDDRAETTGRTDSKEVKPVKEKAEDVEKETANLLSYSSNTNDTGKADADKSSYDSEKVIHDSISNHTPSEIVELFSPFFYGSELYNKIGLLFKAKYHCHFKVRVESHIDAYKACITDVIRRYKQGVIRSLDGYLYASIKRLTRRLIVAG